MTVKPDREFAVATAPKRNSKTWTQGVVTWAELKEWASSPADHKECGNYVLGTLKGTRRRKDTILSRSALTLDVDHATPEFADEFDLSFPYAAILHSTWRSTSDEPRYRLIVPLDRDITPDEYVTAARAVMQSLGEENFDPQSDQPERYMFRPSSQDPEQYEYIILEGDVATVDKLLEQYDPETTSLPAPSGTKSKRDPYELEGIVGAFNRTYGEDLDALITEYDLPYEQVGESRWQLVGTSSAAGMGPVGPGLWYSHHSGDPAAGHAQSAFDLVRLHLYSHLDEDVPEGTPISKLPSHVKMVETATKDPYVVRESLGADFTQEMDETEKKVLEEESKKSGHWQDGLVLSPRTAKPADDIHNWDLIKDNDPAFQSLRYNEMTMSIETVAPLPWRDLDSGTTFGGDDRARLALHIEREYHIRPSTAYLDMLIIDVAKANSYHPIREYLNRLEWDGEERVETSLPGVRPTPYSRMVARKVLTAAVARVMDPGCKWDHMMVIYGKEGLGKSWWINKISRGYSSTLGPIHSKDTLIAMQRSWIMVSDEGHTMKKADFDAQKEFLTRQADIFRMPYDREAQSQPRQCVIWGTTNDETFLRRQEGNRRFLIVHAEDPVDFDALDEYYIDQLWAEAVYLYRSGEQLFLTPEETEMAEATRERFTEEDALVGQLQEFLETLVPEDWDEMSRDARRMWYVSPDELDKPGVVRQDMVCSRQLWAEALDNRGRGEPKRMDLLEIANAMKHVPGWVKVPGQRHVPKYGKQTVFMREEALDGEDIL